MIRVLIADDVHFIRGRLSKAIEQHGDTVVVSGTASNGAKALEWLDEYYADLCVTDIRMPVMDGLTLIEEINKRYPWMKSMVISSYDEFSYAKTSMQLKSLDYLLKPITPETLNRSLGNAIEQILESRNNEAAQILLRRLPLNRDRMSSWVDHIETLRTETLPMLIVETLELLESWVQGRYELLNPLANLWLQTLIEEQASRKLELQLEEGEDLGLGDITLRRQQIRSYFRLCAVRRLEVGASKIMEAMRGIKNGQSTRLIDQMKQYVKDRLSQTIGLQEMADHVNLNRSYMCTLFKQATDQTIGQYVIDERMALARDLLVRTGLKVYEVANRVGYEDIDYFSQLFKKHYGLSPAEYKKRMDQ